MHLAIYVCVYFLYFIINEFSLFIYLFININILFVSQLFSYI